MGPDAWKGKIVQYLLAEYDILVLLLNKGEYDGQIFRRDVKKGFSFLDWPYGGAEEECSDKYSKKSVP